MVSQILIAEIEMQDLKDAVFRILVPASDSDDPDEILQSGERSMVFYDENLHFYIQMTCNETKIDAELLSFLEKNIEIQIMGKLGFIGIAR